jgi:hypothetical protein
MDKNEAYLALSDLIYKGFLTAEMDFDGKLFVFKTMNDKELELVKMYSGRSDRPDYLTRFNNYFLLYSLFMIEDKNILLNREVYLNEVTEFFKSLPSVLSGKVIASLNGLRKTAYDSLRYLEGFTYTSTSRNAWKALNNLSPVSPDFTGIPGTSQLGMNVHQESWVMINKSLDDEENYNQNFYLALMVASSSNPKGARHIRNQHETQTKNMADRRKKLAELGSIEDAKKQWSPEGWAVPTDTAEELVAELERQISGVKDRHDVFIEDYMKKMRDEAQKRAQQAEDRIRAAQVDHDNVFIEGQQRALSPEETHQLLSNKIARKDNVILVSEEGASAQDKEKFYKKIGTRVMTGGKE